DETAGLRVGHEPEGGTEDCGAGALAADQGAGHVEPVLREEVVEVVARHPPGDARVPGADELGVAVAEVAEAAVDLAPPPAARGYGGELVLRGGSHPQARSLVGQDVERFDVVD